MASCHRDGCNRNSFSMCSQATSPSDARSFCWHQAECCCEQVFSRSPFCAKHFYRLTSLREGKEMTRSFRMLMRGASLGDRRSPLSANLSSFISYYTKEGRDVITLSWINRTTQRWWCSFTQKFTFFPLGKRKATNWEKKRFRCNTCESLNIYH